MSDKLKQFIADNEAQFDTTPKPGHFDRFKALQEQHAHTAMNADSQQQQNSSLPMLMKIAAILVLVLGIGWMIFNLGKMQGAQEFATIGNASPIDSDELKEAEFFFTEQVDLKKKEVLAFSNTNNADTKHILLELEKLELQYIDLKEELEINQNNAQIINAMVDNYRMRLSVLERLLAHLKKSNTIKQKHHDEIQA
tara:strand:+ start:75867 stop:76454 length:588 start_codon:yes stop_codon:yes gene_type:complete